MQAFEIPKIIAQQAAGTARYFEFLKVPDLSMGLYVLKVGDEDLQKPHREDEIYIIIGGQAKLRVGDEDRDVQNGSIVYVAKNVPHTFHSITSDLRALAFFAPAESTKS
jgi:mannose-6-phosphate isomerase-like protein (cupin superfamily)